MQLRQNFNLHEFPAVKRLEENIEAQNEEKKIFSSSARLVQKYVTLYSCGVNKLLGNEATVAMCVLFCSLDHVLFF